LPRFIGRASLERLGKLENLKARFIPSTRKGWLQFGRILDWSLAKSQTTGLTKNPFGTWLGPIRVPKFGPRGCIYSQGLETEGRVQEFGVLLMALGENSFFPTERGTNVSWGLNYPLNLWGTPFYPLFEGWQNPKALFKTEGLIGGFHKHEAVWNRAGFPSFGPKV